MGQVGWGWGVPDWSHHPDWQRMALNSSSFCLHFLRTVLEAYTTTPSLKVFYMLSKHSTN